MVVSSFLDVAARGRAGGPARADRQARPYRRVLGYTYVGYLANNVLPARLGELVRSHALGEGEGMSRTTVLGTVVVERVVDTVIVVGLAALAVVVLGVRGIVSTAVVLGARSWACSSSASVVAMALHRLPGADASRAAAERFPRILELARRLREGLAVVEPAGTVVGALAFSALAWTASIPTFLRGGQAARHRPDRRAGRCCRAASPSPRSCRRRRATSARSS